MLLAVLASAALVCAAPFVGEFRRWLAAAVPGQYVGIVNGIVAIAVMGVAISAVRSIRTRRAWRFGLIASALAIAAAYARITGSPVPAVAAVEHVHFVQYGVITWLFYRAWRGRGDVAGLILPCVAAFVFGVAEEWWQWFLPARVGELRDVLLNTVAIGCGLMVAAALSPPEWLPTGSRTGAARAALTGGAVALVAVSAFTWTVHVGHTIADPAIGQFKSRYTARELLDLSEDRRAKWATNPPLVRRALAREDQYRSEGEAHVRARNEAWERGDVTRAWGENQILEKYFAPVLDAPSHISRTGHRWPPDQRADAERRVAAQPPAPFVSAAAVDTKWG